METISKCKTEKWTMLVTTKINKLNDKLDSKNKNKMTSLPLLHHSGLPSPIGLTPWLLQPTI